MFALPMLCIHSNLKIKMANEFLAKLKNYNLDEDTVRDMYAEHINSNYERIVTTITLNNRFSYK